MVQTLVSLSQVATDVDHFGFNLQSVGKSIYRSIGKSRGRSYCNTRLQKNALRIFDCKNPQCQSILDERAPLIFDSISREDKQHFNAVLEILDKLKIQYIIDLKLVRGLDYYNKTVFEWKSSSLGAQDTICGGGRYDSLVEELGGKPCPAIGFSIGLERLVLISEKIDVEKSS